jgi:hypothetical protein
MSPRICGLADFRKSLLAHSADLTDSKNLNGFQGQTNSGSPYRTIYNETVKRLPERVMVFF